MNILMMTNTYLPHVGGVANSVNTYTQQLRKLGHHVIVVAPHFEGENEYEEDVIRIPALQQIKGSEFSMILPIPGFLDKKLRDFKPDIVHSHHPFFVGSVAVRIASKYNVPLIFTQHTMYEHYTHYGPAIPRMKAFVINLSVGYANMCNYVIAPSKSFARILKLRGVKVPIEVVPTAVDIEKFQNGNGQQFRTAMNIPPNAFTIGHTGRLEPEKNMDFLIKAVAMFLHKNSNAHFLLVGYGTLEKQLKEIFYFEGLSDRVHFVGKLTGQSLIDAYHAMDTFVFASKTETQGIVLAEAMAAGIPVIALDATGASDVVENGINGYLVKSEDIESFAAACCQISQLPKEVIDDFKIAARNTAEDFNIQNFTIKINSIYERMFEIKNTVFTRDESVWRNAVEQIAAEWNLLANFMVSVGDALYRDSSK